VAGLDREMTQVLRRLVQRHHTTFERHAGRLRPSLLRHPATRCRERLAVVQARGQKAITASLEGKYQRLDALSQLLRSLSHKSVLDRGFVLVRDKDGHPVRHVGDAEAAGRVELEFTDGRTAATIESDPLRERPAPSPARKPAATARPAAAQQKVNDPQGQLF
jgi:exodeoxyribonuclease VII large subunit